MRDVAVTTYTRRHVVDMLPEFLTKRAAPFGPQGEAYAKELGLPRPALAGLSNSMFFRDGDVVRRDTYVWRSPYAKKRADIENQRWPDLVSAGLAEEVEGGWRLTPRAIEIGQDVGRRVRAQLRSFAFPSGPLGRAAEVMEQLASRIPLDAERVARARRLRPMADEPKAVITRLNAAVYELWSFRDDCHVGAWQDAGYEGPVFDVLSFIWAGRPDMSWTKQAGSGATSFDALAEALKQRQDRADVELAVAVLEKRGDVQRDGDAVQLTPQGQKRRDSIEDETDRRFFAIWDLDDAATARLGEDLRAVIDALPKGP